MKRGIDTGIDWAFIGASLANGEAEEQAAFFAAFANECKTWGTHFQVEMQMISILRLLTKEQIEILEMLKEIKG